MKKENLKVINQADDAWILCLEIIAILDEQKPPSSCGGKLWK